MKKMFSKSLSGMIAGLAVFAGAVSCTNEDFAPVQEQNDGFKVVLSLSEQDFTQVQTKTMEAASIKDLAVLQFQGGKLAKQFILEDQAFTSGALNVTEFASQAATTLDESGKMVENGNENIIVFLANMKANGMFTLNSTFTTGTTTYAQFLAQSYKFTDADAITNAQYIPMYGSWTKGLTDGVTNSISVTMTRAMAYIYFTIKTDNFTLPASEGTLQGSPIVSNVKIHNVPLALTLANKKVRPALPVNYLNGVWSDGSKDGASAYPAYADADFVDFDEVAELAQTGDASVSTFKFYVNENCRGSYDAITTYAQKKAKTGDKSKSSDANYMAGITYMTFDITYSTVEGKEGVASYRINLGGNNTGDFNIRGGAQYNVTTNVYGIGNDGERTNIDINYTFNVVDVTPTTSGDVTVLADANCYMLQPSKISDNKYDGKTLVIRLTQPRTGWKYVQANDAPATGNYATDFEYIVENGKYTLETLWQTSGGAFNVAGTTASDIMTAGSGVSDAMKNYFVKITSLPAPSNNCSALIVLKATEAYNTIAANDILWSWHLWFTDYNFDGISAPAEGSQGVATTVGNGQTHRYAGAAFSATGEYAKGLGMMDRNLGATYTASTTSISDWVGSQSSAISISEGTDFSKLRGMYYQFGRPTPFPQVTSTSGDIASSSLVKDSFGYAFAFAYETVLQSAAQLKYAINHPASYISDGSVWRTLTATEDWPEIFDPSPAGWCLPKADASTEYKNPWWDFGSSDNKYTTPCSWTSNVKGAVYTGISSVSVYYPAAGFVNRTSGAFCYVGSYGSYWSQAGYSASNGRYLSFNSSALTRSNSDSRAYAFPVRPVQKN